MNAEMRDAVWQRANSRCEYCRIHAEDRRARKFHVEHVHAVKHGGSDDLQNLALACPDCNFAKSSDLAGIVNGKIVPLFHPRRQNWSRHFYWDGPFLEGKTLCGKATIYVLDINNVLRVQLRQELIDEGRFPPED